MAIYEFGVPFPQYLERPLETYPWKLLAVAACAVFWHELRRWLHRSYRRLCRT